jgi:O-antigen ligase
MQERSVVSSKFFQMGLTLSLAALFAAALGRGDQEVFAAALGIVVLGCSFLWYEILSLPVLIACFFWTGMNIPFNNLAETARWAVLGMAAVVGVMVWIQKEGGFRIGNIHVLAALATATLMLSYDVSPNPSLTLLKSASVGLLFLYSAAGALTYIQGRQTSFFKAAALCCEMVVYASVVSYGVLGYPVYGNPNSLGAIMGVVAWPLLLWDLITTENRIAWRRKLFALVLCGWLLQHSLARASFLAALVSSLLLLFVMKRRSVMIGIGIAAILGGILLSAFNPDGWETLIQGAVYKNKPGTEILQSRRPRWQESLDEIQRRPWFGNGFGAARDVSEEWKGGVSTQTFNRERGSSYLTVISGVGFIGAIPILVLLIFIGRRIFMACRRIRHSGKILDASMPMAAVLTASLCHAIFEDWLFAAGYYLSVLFWIFAFALAHREETGGPLETHAD